MTAAQVLNRTIFTGDNLPVLRGINTASVDLVYLDPPFNSKKQWSAPIGSRAAGAAFKDTWTLSDVDLQWHDQLRAVNPRLNLQLMCGSCNRRKGAGSMSKFTARLIRERTGGY